MVDGPFLLLLRLLLRQSGRRRHMSAKFSMPIFLRKHGIDQNAYLKWLTRKAAAHVKRDRKRSLHEITGSDYRLLIHEAVCQSDGCDYYTGEHLHWDKIGTYSNEHSREGRSIYKAGFALLPTADHVLMEDGRYKFVICAWRTNDAKNDLSHADFVKVCRLVVVHEDGRT